MEIVETEVETENVVVINTQPEFITDYKDKVNVRYFVILENNEENELSKNVFECSVAGLDFASWVSRACESEPVVLRVSENQNILPLIKPYIAGAELSVVLYASTPLVRKSHIRDLIGFVINKHLSVCRLKKGFVFRNDYIANVDEIFSIDTYDFSSDDFFEVKTQRDFEYAELMLNRRVLEFHRKNNVNISSSNVYIDASAEIGYNSKISSGVAIKKGSKLGTDCVVGTSVSVLGSIIGDDTEIKDNVVIENSVIKNGVKIEAGSVIKNSVIGENTIVGTKSLVIHSGLKQNVNVGDGVTLNGARISENVIIKSAAKVVMVQEPTIVLGGATIDCGAEVFDTTIAANTKVEPFKKVTNVAGDK